MSAQLHFLVSILFSLIVSIGVGAFTARALRLPQVLFRVGLSGLLGMLAIGSLALWVNFFLPLQAGFLGCVTGVAIFGLVWNWRRIRLRQLIFISGSAFTYWIWGLRGPPGGDTGLYHLPVIHWMNESPLPLGLANLHDRFGSWNFWFSVTGAFNAGQLFPYMIFSLNVPLTALALGDMLSSIRKPASHQARNFTLSILFLAFLCDRAQFIEGQKSPNADFAGVMTALWAFFYFQQRNKLLNRWVLPTILISSFTVLLKLNFLPIILMIPFVFWLRRKHGESAQWKHAFTLASLIAVSFLGMSLKSFWTTGCILFPAENSCFEVPWKLPLLKLRDYMMWVKSWARSPGKNPMEVLGNWHWLAPWFAGLFKNWVVISLTAASFLFAAFKLMFPKRLKLDIHSVLIVALWLVYWFLSAPDIRFGYAPFAVLFCMMGSSLLSLASTAPILHRHKNWMKQALTAGATLIILASCIRQILRADDWGASNLKVPLAITEVRTNIRNQPIHVASPAECWDSPLPCTPYFDPSVVELQWRGIREFTHAVQ